MKLIKQKAELLPWEPGIEGVYKTIERAGRTCYKSEDKITEGSAKPFVDRMIASNHLAMLEHGTVYLTKEVDYTSSDYLGLENKYESNKYTKVSYDGGTMYITTNLRVLVENGWLEDLKYLSDPTEYHEMRYSFRLTTDRGVSHELVRHRVFSFAQESQRYCNYSKEKYGKEITFIKPSWLNVPVGTVYWHDGICWRIQQDENNPMEWFSIKPREGFSDKEAHIASMYFNTLNHVEDLYFSLLKYGFTAQEARTILPNATKTEICMTGFASDWRHFFDLRYFERTGKVHPDMKELTQLMYNEAEKQGILSDIINMV